LNDPNSSVAVTVNPPLVTLGQAKPALQVEIVVAILEFPLADEKSGEETDHDHDHLLMDGIIGTLESIDQSLELRLALRAAPAAWFEGRRDLLDVLDVASQCLLFGPNLVQAAVNTVGQAA
jgi:hypothetical protein